MPSPFATNADGSPSYEFELLAQLYGEAEADATMRVRAEAKANGWPAPQEPERRPRNHWPAVPR